MIRPRTALAAALLAAVSLTPAQAASAKRSKTPSLRQVERKVADLIPTLGGMYARSGTWVRECSRSGQRRWDCEIGSLDDRIDSTYVIARYNGKRFFLRRAGY